MKRMHRPRSRAVIASVVVLTTAGALTSIASPAFAVASFGRTSVDTALQGAAFTAVGDVLGNANKEIVTTGYGVLGGGPSGPVLSDGTVRLYTNTDSLPSGITNWSQTTIVPTSEHIIFPNQPKLADVDGDGDVDVIIPNGYFFDSLTSANRGGITWWEQSGASWLRHNIVTNSPWAYHELQYVDFDGDGIKDIVTVGEQGLTAASIADDLTETQLFPGTGGGNFAAPIVLANDGGSSPVVDDVNGDGKLDIITAQYFGVNPVVVPPSGKPSFLWIERTGPAVGPLTSADFTTHAISTGQGPAFGIYKAPNLYGDSVDRWIGVNHTNKTTGNPGPPLFLRAAPQIFLLTPTAVITDPWTVAPLATTVDPGATIASTYNPGQAAPGKAGVGDLDNDGDLDVTLSGDGDRRLFWLEQVAPGNFTQHQLDNSTGWGQAGGSIVTDLNNDGLNEAVFSSYDQNHVAIWSSAIPVEVPSGALGGLGLALIIGLVGAGALVLNRGVRRVRSTS